MQATGVWPCFQGAEKNKVFFVSFNKVINLSGLEPHPYYCHWTLTTSIKVLNSVTMEWGLEDLKLGEHDIRSRAETHQRTKLKSYGCKESSVCKVLAVQAQDWVWLRAHMKKAGMAMHICDRCFEGQNTRNFWGSLAIQPSQTAEFQAKQETLTQKSRQTAPACQCLLLTSGLHTSVYTSAHAPTLMNALPSPKHTPSGDIQISPLAST